MLRERMPTIEEAIQALTATENLGKTLAEMKEEIQVLTTAYMGMAKAVVQQIEEDRFNNQRQY